MHYLQLWLIELSRRVTFISSELHMHIKPNKFNGPLNETELYARLNKMYFNSANDFSLQFLFVVFPPTGTAS